MAYDGIMTAAMAAELFNTIAGAKIEKIYQPEKEELLLHLHTKEGKKKLFLSAASHHARVHLTKENYDNPASPSSFCMLLRKHLQGGRITDIFQKGCERIIEFEIETLDEMGFNVNRKLICEIMGKHSNIVLIDEGTGKIIDSIKRVSIDTSRVRQLLPGLLYQYPPAQEKISFKEFSTSDIEKIKDNKILNIIGGISPVIADEIYNLGPGSAYETLSHITQQIKELDFSPCVYFKEDNSPLEFSIMPLTIYDGILKKQEFDSISECIEFYYQNKQSSNRLKQKSQDVKKAVEQKLKKAYTKKQRLLEDLDAALNSDSYRLFGELLTANLHLAKTGDTKVKVINYYDGKEIEIPLDKRFSPSKNAQNYYKKYGKAKTAIKEKKLQLEENENDIVYLEQTVSFLENATSSEDIDQIRDELANEGYLKKRKVYTQKKKAKAKPLEFTSSKGFRILVGKTSTENDYLTTKLAQRSDLWLHTKDIPGSHVIVCLEGKEPDEDTILEAARLAAYYSKARNSSQVPVDYVKVKYVKKPAGAKPGMVIFTNNKTVYVTPELLK